MAYPNSFTQTDLTAVINQVWSPRIEREFQANMVFGNFFENRSDERAVGGNKINVSGIFTNQLTTANKVNGAAVSAQQKVLDSVTLTIDTWKECSFVFEDLEAQLVLQSANTAMEYQSQARYVTQKAFETAIATALNAGADYAVSDKTSNVTEAVLREAIEILQNQDVPFDTYRFFFHPTTYWGELQAETKFYQYLQSGKILQGGYGNPQIVQYVYGVPTASTTLCPKSSDEIDNFLATPKSLMYAIATPGGNIRSQAEYKLEYLGNLWVTDIMFGVHVLRPETAVVIKAPAAQFVS